MLRKIFKLPKAIKLAGLWQKAETATAEGRYKAALESLTKMEEIAPLTIKAKLLKCLVLYRVENFRQGVTTACEARDQILSSMDESPTKNYLSAYADYIGLCCETKLEPKNYQFGSYDLNTINLSDVPKSLKRTFKLTNHPHWESPGSNDMGSRDTALSS